MLLKVELVFLSETNIIVFVKMNMFGYHLNQRRFMWNFMTSVAAAVAFISLTSSTKMTSIFYSAPEDSYSFFLILRCFVLDLIITASPLIALLLQMYFLQSIRIRFCLLNMALRDTFGQPNEAIDLLNCLMVQHDNLTGSVGLINHCYSIQVRLTSLFEFELNF